MYPMHMFYGSRRQTAMHLRQWNTQVGLWQRTLENSIDFCKCLSEEDRMQIAYLLNNLRDHLDFYQARII